MPLFPTPSPAEARAFLASTHLFKGLDDAALDEVLAQLEWLLVPGGSCVCREGEEGDSLYLVVTGRLAILRELENAEDLLLAEVGRGESFGEISILTGKPRSATVRALRDSVLARLPRERGEILLRRNPGFTLALTRTLVRWLEPPRPAESTGCVAVALAGTAGAPLADFVVPLVQALSAIGPTLLLSCEGIDRELGAGTGSCLDGSAGHSRMVSWLYEQEARHAFLLYQADPDPSGWTRRCLRQADRILVAAPAGAEPDLGPLGQELARLEQDDAKPREELVLLHGDPDARPQGTKKWLGLRRFARHHHVRLFHPGDVQRLARFVAGREVGLVLGGGGARGFAHIGVIRALEEAGIPIDRVGGTSMGALIGALHAHGYDWQSIVELNRWGWVQGQPHKVYTLPLISLLSPVKAETMLERMYGDDQIEDLWLSFFCVSANITRAEVVVHREGLLRKWVGTSIRIPGVVPPVVQDGELLVDGGVLNNLPADVMRRLGEGPVIAVDVSAKFDVRADASYRETPSPWQLLAARLRFQKPKPFPNILRLIHRSALLASDVYAKSTKSEVDLYLDLPVDGFDMFGVEAIDELVDLGYRFTAEKLAATAWKPEPGKRLAL
ncbi:MAG TPA: patatin-like phospholipase family protein [Thermoanaerobaculia bacterium]